ncbi:Ribosomal lysine N-methyltransferase 3 [Bienertia sinuspersici]
MFSHSIQFSDALQFLDTLNSGICVKSKTQLKEGDLIATIPKTACLTTRTSGASQIIEAADLDGFLGLAVAIMYERSLGLKSPWYGYLQQTVKEDKALIHEDWKEYILPLIQSEEFGLDPKYFGVEDYFAARSLIASRSFQIDDYHGFGMVPLADLFNHKTGAEDVHFTTVPSPDESDESAESVDDDEDDSSDEFQTQASQRKENCLVDASVGLNISDGPDLVSDNTSDNPLVLEMILVKDVEAEPGNPYDIVNIDLELVLQWSSSLFSGRHSRARLSLWRKLGYSSCESQNSEYFEISYDGEPQLELLILLYLILLPEENFSDLDLAVASKVNSTEHVIADISVRGKILQRKICEMSSDILLTKSVCEALISLADIRERLYGTSSLEHDVEILRKCDCSAERKLYNSLVLRVGERRIIEKLRNYAEAGNKALYKVQRSHLRKKLKS